MRDRINDGNATISLKLKVTPKAKSEQIKKVIHPDGSESYKVYVTVPAENGKANKAVIALIAKEWGIAKSKVTIKYGINSREKIIEVSL